MRTHLLFLVFIGLGLSCISEEPQIKQTQETQEFWIDAGRLRFQSRDLLFKTIEKLNQMTDEEFRNWNRASGIKSIQSDIELYPASDRHDDFKYFPKGYLAILNTDHEVVVGDTIIWYSKMVKHVVPNLNESYLKEIKNNPSISNINSAYWIEGPGDEMQSELGRINVSPKKNSTDAVVPGGYHYEFNYCLNQTKRKYVSELYALRDSWGTNSFWSFILLRIKLEYYGSNGWKSAGEYRRIFYDVNASFRFLWRANAYSPTISKDPSSGYLVRNFSGYTERNSDLSITIDSRSGSGVPLFWDIEVYGFIDQSISMSYPPAPGGIYCNPYRVPSPEASGVIW